LINRHWVNGLMAGAIGAAVLALLAFFILPSETFGLRFWAFLVAGGFALGLGHSWIARVGNEHRRDDLDALLRSLSRGDLTVGSDARAAEVSEEFPGFRRVLRSFQNIITYLQDTSESVSSASGNISDRTRGLFGEVRDQVASVDQAKTAIRQLDKDIEQVVENVDTLSNFAEETGSAFLEMRASSEEVMGSTHNLAGFMDEIGASIDEMARSVQEVAENAESLSSFAIENASAMVEMDATIGQIEENIRETEGLSKQVATAASAGSGVVKDTTKGLESIHATMTKNLEAMDSLSQRSKEIGTILKVIREIADQTNLLALNAAIIAAQAGEHGKSFGVVAEEIRDLSERTAASTSEVGAITATIQGQVDQAVRVAREGMVRVEEGLRLGQASESHLQRIGQFIELAATGISHISRAASEQSKGSKQVTAAIEEMTKRIERISLATREQARTSQVISQRSLVIKDLTNGVDRAMGEQVTGSEGIARGMDRVRSSVESIQKALIRMSQAGERIVNSMETISGSSHQTLGGIRDLAATSSSLRQEALLLVEQLGSFAVPKPVRGGEIRVGYTRYNFNLDPAFANNIRDGELCHNFNEGLLRFGYGAKLLPGLAERWEASTDGLVYTFWLRANAVFHNGRKVTAEDVVFSWHRSASPRLDTGGQWFLSSVLGGNEYMAGQVAKIEGLKAADDRTLEVRLKEPLAFFLYMLCSPESAVIPREAVDERSLRMLRPVGCGPYRILDSLSDKVVMERFGGYHSPEIPYTDRLVLDYSAVTEPDLLENLRSGRIHSALALSNDALEDLLSDPFWENNTENTVLLNTQLLAIRNDMAPGNIREFRQALNYAVDREGLLAKYPHVRVTPAKGILPPGILGYKSDRKGYYYDPEKARWLLGRAGFGSGLDLKIALDESRKSQMQEFMLIVEMFGKVGIRIEPELVSHDEFESRRKRTGGRPLLYPTGWYADYPDPDNFLFVVFHKEGGDQLQNRYHSDELDTLVEQARRSMDVEERVVVYQKAEDLLVEDAPCVFLYHSWGMAPHRPEVMGMKLSLTPPMVRPEHLWIGKEHH
jgi:oligopeptide transport system substrate-binding protein